jgi:hypothetical protein
LGAARKASAAEMFESVSTDSRRYPQIRRVVDASWDRMTLRIRYLTWKLRALC